LGKINHVLEHRIIRRVGGMEGNVPCIFLTKQFAVAAYATQLEGTITQEMSGQQERPEPF